MKLNRINLLEKYILEKKSVSLDILCKEFNVSKNTIRRDINILLSKGIIKKVYGGVTVSDNITDYRNELLSFEERNNAFKNEKDTICRIAANYVCDNDVIYIDTGTTCMNMIRYLGDKKCTILTNSLQLCISALSYPNLTIFSLPGKLKRETLSFVVNEIADYLKVFNINKAFMACTGITIKNGLTNSSAEEYNIKKAVIENSNTHFVLADHSKFGKFALMTYCPIEKVDFVITDKIPPDEYVEFFKNNDITADFL